MTMHFHEYNLSLLSITALLLDSQVYYLLGRGKYKTSHREINSIIRWSLIPVNCITMKPIMTETPEDFAGCWFKDLSS